MSGPYYTIRRNIRRNQHHEMFDVVRVDGEKGSSWPRFKVISTHASKNDAIKAASLMMDDANKGSN